MVLCGNFVLSRALGLPLCKMVTTTNLEFIIFMTVLAVQ